MDQRLVESPWGTVERAAVCWACSKPLGTLPAVVVDAVSPKVVHAAPPCRTALTPLRQS